MIIIFLLCLNQRKINIYKLGLIVGIRDTGHWDTKTLFSFLHQTLKKMELQLKDRFLIFQTFQDMQEEFKQLFLVSSFLCFPLLLSICLFLIQFHNFILLKQQKVKKFLVTQTLISVDLGNNYKSNNKKINILKIIKLLNSVLKIVFICFCLKLFFLVIKKEKKIDN